MLIYVPQPKSSFFLLIYKEIKTFSWAPKSIAFPYVPTGPAGREAPG